MNRKKRKSVAEPIVQMQRELEEYRRMQPRRAKLPESIWGAAAELAGEHGVYAVAQALRYVAVYFHRVFRCLLNAKIPIIDKCLSI